MVEEWSADRPGLVLPASPGYLQRIELDDLVTGLPGQVERAAVLVRPGDFVSVEQPLVAVWPATELEQSTPCVRRACRIEQERDLAQDLDFGLRQLTDTAVKAMSPGINDPTTACTCIGYIRSILVRLAERAFPEPVRHYPERDLTLVARRREFDEYVDCLAEIGHHAHEDARVTRALLEALASVCESARGVGLGARADAAGNIARAIGQAALNAASNEHERQTIDRVLARFGRR